jgi:hypothetical protein
MSDNEEDAEINLKLLVENVDLDKLDLLELKMTLNRKADEININICSSLSYVLDVKTDNDCCFIYFLDPHDCSYGLMLNGIEYQGVILKISRPPEYEDPRDSYISWHFSNRLEINPYIMETRSSRIVYFEPLSQDLEIGFEAEVTDCLNELMLSMNMGFTEEIRPVLYARFNKGNPFVEMRSLEAAVNVLNLNNFPFKGIKFGILTPHSLKWCNFFTYDELICLENNQRFKLLSVGLLSTVVVILVYPSKEDMDFIETTFITPYFTNHPRSICSISRLINGDIEVVDGKEREMSRLFIEMRTVSDTLELVDILVTNMGGLVTIRFFNERKYHCNIRKCKLDRHLVLVKGNVEEEDADGVLTLYLEDLHLRKS